MSYLFSFRLSFYDGDILCVLLRFSSSDFLLGEPGTRDRQAIKTDIVSHFLLIEPFFSSKNDKVLCSKSLEPFAVLTTDVRNFLALVIIHSQIGVETTFLFPICSK